MEILGFRDTLPLRVVARGSKLAVLLALVACGTPVRDPVVAPKPAPGTRLVVLLVIDQWPQWSFIEKRPHLTGGFDRLLREGEWLTGEHPSGATLTAPGHALIGTGEPPAGSGILANEWWDRESERMVPSVEGIGNAKTARLRVHGLGDAVAASKRGGKAVGISMKDRAALLPLGHAGTGIWVEVKVAEFTATQPLDWLAAYNHAHPISARVGEVWTPLDPARIAKLSGRRDDEPGEIGEHGLASTFPHSPSTTPDPVEAVFATPLGNDLVLDVAEAALAGEHLGTDATADLLVISLSAHDYAGHGWGHESWELWDMTLRLDTRLGRFLAVLDEHVGAGRWTMVVTSDHGASPLPERIGGGRIRFDSLMDAANRAAIAELGPGEWISSVKFPFVWLSAAARAQPDRERGIALKKIMLAFRSYPGIELVGKTADFAGNCETRTGAAAVICSMIDRERSGEIFYLPRRGWLFEKADDPVATAHNSHHDVDREVPLIVLRPDRHSHAPLAKPTGKLAMTEVSTLVTTWLGVPNPRSLGPR